MDWMGHTIIVTTGAEDYIGLLLTAGKVCATCTAVFSNVSVIEGYIDWDGSDSRDGCDTVAVDVSSGHRHKEQHCCAAVRDFAGFKQTAKATYGDPPR